MEQEESAYITSVNLKGYKSIRDVSVTLNKGLNILIGANGSGKTNFLEFLDFAYENDYENLFDVTNKFETQIIKNTPFVKMKGERVFQKNIKYRVEINYGEGNKHGYLLNDDKKIVKYEEAENDIPDYETMLLLRFENPISLILKEKISLKVSVFSIVDKKTREHLEATAPKYILTEIKSFNKNNVFLGRLFNYFNDSYDSLKTIIENQPFDFKELQRNLALFSPIQNIKLDWEITRTTIKEDEIGQYALIEGIDFQFYVNNEWINWTQLSDGTKRLFYLIGSVTYATENEIILIEEPELGVHPHQLALLMNFLKSESEDKQIIISTHSPQVLNCLGEDELDRIIVARHEGKAGTKLYHLSEEEKGYASAYMINEAFLSDYWVLSEFMNEEPTENG